MSLSENLQNLRKIKNMSQEELAERLNVSRQAVSKWESGSGYQETEKIINICEIFECSMDELVKGKITENVKKDKNDYDLVITKAAKGIALGVGIILLCVALMLTLIGFAPNDGSQETFSLIGVVIILIGVVFAVPMFIINGTKLDNFKKKNPVMANVYSEEEMDNGKSKYTKILAVGISTILIGVVAMMALIASKICGENALPVAILMYFITLGVTTIVYAGQMQSKYDIEKYNKENSTEYKEKNDKAGKICGVIMLLATAAFLIWGFCFNGWKIAWVVYPIGGLLCGITSTIFGKK